VLLPRSSARLAQCVSSSGTERTRAAPSAAVTDDFVILSRGRAAEALAWTKAVMTKLGLTSSNPWSPSR